MKRTLPKMTIQRTAKVSADVDEVPEVWDDFPPEEVIEMLKKFVSPDTESPARLSIGGDLAFKDYGAGYGAHVSLSFDVDPDAKVIDQANDEVGELVRGYLAENFTAAEDLYNQLRRG